MHKKKYILITGAAGFIGYHVCKNYLRKGYNVIGIDNLNSYYSVKLKKDRLRDLYKIKKKLIFLKVDIKNKSLISKIFKKYKIDRVYHLAAQAGVRKSVKFPNTYIQNNIIGTTNLFEVVKNYKKIPMIVASSSSVYGKQKEKIFKTDLKTDTPIQMYAVSKKATELISYSYNFQYKIPVVLLRFFTVYGPWGRPDMALFKFTKKILLNRPIQVYNKGNHFRDFTYIDDVIKKIELSSKMITRINQNSKFDNFKILNLGNGNPYSLKKFINLLEKALKKKAKIEYLPAQQGDMIGTYSDVNEFNKKLKKIKSYPLFLGIKKFTDWYIKYYGKN